MARHSFEDRRENIAKELLATERSYVADLEVIVNGFMPNNSCVGGSECLSDYEWGIVFGNIEAVLACNRCFLSRLEMAIETGLPSGGYGVFAPCFTEHKAEFAAVYTEYCRNYRQAEQFLISRKEDRAVQAYIRACTSHLNLQLGLEASLLKPIQRILKYPLLLNELVKHTPDGYPETGVLANAKAHMDALASDINAKARSDAEALRSLTELIQGWTGDEYSRGRKIAESDVLVSKVTATRGPGGIVIATRKSTKARVAVLFDRAFMLLSRRVIHMRHKYAVSADIPLGRAKVLSVADGDGISHAWEILHMNTHKKYMILHKTAEEKADFGTTVIRQILKVSAVSTSKKRPLNPSSLPTAPFLDSAMQDPSTSRIGEKLQHHRSLPDLAAVGVPDALLAAPSSSVSSASASSIRPVSLTTAGLLSLPETPNISSFVPSTGNSTPTSSDSERPRFDFESEVFAALAEAADAGTGRKGGQPNGGIVDMSADLDKPGNEEESVSTPKSAGLNRQNQKKRVKKTRDSAGSASGGGVGGNKSSLTGLPTPPPDVANGASHSTAPPASYGDAGGGAVAVSAATEVCVAVVAYQPFEGDPDSLPLVVGDIVRVIRGSDGLGDKSRWLVSKGSARGLVPSAVLKRLRVEPSLDTKSASSSLNKMTSGASHLPRAVRNSDGTQSSPAVTTGAPDARPAHSVGGGGNGFAPSPATNATSPRRRQPDASMTLDGAMTSLNVAVGGTRSPRQSPLASPRGSISGPDGHERARSRKNSASNGSGNAAASVVVAGAGTSDAATQPKPSQPPTRGVVRITAVSNSNARTNASASASASASVSAAPVAPASTTPRLQRTISVRSGGPGSTAIVATAANASAAAAAPSTPQRSGAEPKTYKRMVSLQGRHVTNSPFLELDKSMNAGSGAHGSTPRKRSSKASTNPDGTPSRTRSQRQATHRSVFAEGWNGDISSAGIAAVAASLPEGCESAAPAVKQSSAEATEPASVEVPPAPASASRDVPSDAVIPTPTPTIEPRAAPEAVSGPPASVFREAFVQPEQPTAPRTGSARPVPSPRNAYHTPVMSNSATPVTTPLSTPMSQRRNVATGGQAPPTHTMSASTQGAITPSDTAAPPPATSAFRKTTRGSATTPRGSIATPRGSIATPRKSSATSEAGSVSAAHVSATRTRTPRTSDSTADGSNAGNATPTQSGSNGTSNNAPARTPSQRGTPGYANPTRKRTSREDAMANVANGRRGSSNNLLANKGGVPSAASSASAMAPSPSGRRPSVRSSVDSGKAPRTKEASQSTSADRPVSPAPSNSSRVSSASATASTGVRTRAPVAPKPTGRPAAPIVGYRPPVVARGASSSSLSSLPGRPGVSSTTSIAAPAPATARKPTART